MFYSKSTSGFYDVAVHGDNIPPDAVEISSEYHTWLLDGQSTGKIISADENGYPILADPPAPTQDEHRAAIQAQIDEIEQSTLVPRITREFMLTSMELEAERVAADTGTTKEAVLEAHYGYQKIFAVEEQIKALRAQLKALA